MTPIDISNIPDSGNKSRVKSVKKGNLFPLLYWSLNTTVFSGFVTVAGLAIWLVLMTITAIIVAFGPLSVPLVAVPLGFLASLKK